MAFTLSEAPVLILDCQATGPRPGRDHLLEVGWTVTSAAALSTGKAPKVRAFLVAPQAGIEIPLRVRRVTGISEAALERGCTRRLVWEKLRRAARSVASGWGEALCPTLIHFAAFERPYLEALRSEFAPRSGWPFQLLCTHAIAKRLWPHLPRKGLRAVAGYLGFGLDEFHRSAAHVRATAAIWKELAARLESEHGVADIAELARWLARPAAAPAGRRRAYPMDLAARRALPNGPGIYRMLGRDGRLLYVGKALALRRRVASYFRPAGPQAEHILEMLSQAFHLDHTPTASGLEAALLEADTIKALRPPYNVALKNAANRLVYCSRDLQHEAEDAAAGFPVGPLPAGRDASFLKSFGAWHAAGPDAPAAGLIDLPAERAPDPAVLAAGVALFAERSRTWLKAGSALGALGRYGIAIRRRTASAAPELPEPSFSAEEPQPEWSPAGVALAIEQAVESAARLIRRARWFRLISNAAILWPERRPGDATLHRLEIRGGRVAGRGADRPAAPQRRCLALDRTDYDRLRVLTTELRRLLAEGRPVCVHPCGGAPIDGPRLARLLPWV